MSRLSTTDPSLLERLDEMARTDPSATVCLLAKYYLENPENRAVSKAALKARPARLAKTEERPENEPHN